MNVPYKDCPDRIVNVNFADLRGGKSIGQLMAEELDRKIAKDIIDVLKKYFPNSEINEKKVIRFAKMLIDTESGGEE